MVQQSPQVIILLPSRNEEKGLGEVIDRIPNEQILKLGYDPRIVVVDGDSDDSTCEIAIRKGVELIHQTGIMGKGGGFKQATEAIFNQGTGENDLLIMLDADATYRPEDITRFIEELDNYDVVWGSRLRGKMEKGAMSSINRLGNILLSLSASVLNFKRTTDLCTGYWGFRAPVLGDMNLTARGFSLEAELFGATCKAGHSTKEIAIAYAHREGQSNLRWYIDGPKIFYMIIRKRLSRI